MLPECFIRVCQVFDLFLLVSGLALHELVKVSSLVLEQLLVHFFVAEGEVDVQLIEMLLVLSLELLLHFCLFKLRNILDFDHVVEC